MVEVWALTEPLLASEMMLLTAFPVVPAAYLLLLAM
jgi:hypothetical protein